MHFRCIIFLFNKLILIFNMLLWKGWKGNNYKRVSETSQALTTTTASLVGATFWIVTIMNLINSSSMINLWAMVNQVQLFLLFILTRAFIPPDVKNIITGVKFTLNITPYIYLPNIGLTDLIKEEFDSPLSNQDLSLLNINSDSSIINVFPIISLSLMIALFHMFVTLIYKFVPAEELQGRWKLIKRQSIRVINKLFSILTFSWYIRYMFESNQYVLISWINEISMFNLSDSKKTVSFVFSICLLCFCLWLILFISWLSLSSYEVLKNSHNKFGEIFHGVKMQRKNKFYVPVLFIRRAIFVILLMTLTSIQSWILISILSFIQLWYLVFIIILRPFEYIKDNIIEISNEIFFCILLSILIFFNSEENWSPKKTEVYKLKNNVEYKNGLIWSKCYEPNYKNYTWLYFQIRFFLILKFPFFTFSKIDC